MKITHPDDATNKLRVPIEASRTEAGLLHALESLIKVARGFPRGLGKDAPFLVVSFHGEGHWISERRFFERAAQFPSLRPKIAEYIDCVNPKKWKSDPFHGAGFWTSVMTPAGSLAAVPLALADKSYIDVAIRQMRGSDLDHETFQRAFIAKLVEKYGICDETLRLLAFRAVDGAGQDGQSDLAFYAAGPLKPHLDSFAKLVDAQSQRTSYRSLYVSNAGGALFGGDAARFNAWIAFFEKRGLKFEAREKKAPEKRDLQPPGPWKEEWEDAASCEDRD